MKKSIFAFPLVALAMILPTTETVVNGYVSGSTVYVIYDADEGTFTDGLNMKSFAVRKGITWDRRNAREMPTDDPIPNETQMQFGSWYYNGEEIASDFIINKDIRVTANYVAGTSEGNFQEDAWPVLAKVIEDSKSQEDPIKYIRRNYDRSGDPDNPKHLTGQTKSIRFNGQNYLVRVIGEGQDYQDYDETKTAKEQQYTNPVALTFEFVNTFDVVPFMFDAESNNYKNSHLADFLNNDVFNLFDKTASRYMKSVYKCTNVGDGNSTESSAGDLEPVLSKVFPISLRELNAEKYNEQAATIHTEYDFPYDIEEESGRDGDSGVYEYYKNATLPSLAKTDIYGQKTSYWTRSPEVESYDWVWHINENGEIGDPDYEPGGYMEQIPNFVQSSISVCPCFCY